MKVYLGKKNSLSNYKYAEGGRIGILDKG